MLIDLERNDLGRVCDPGTVVVDEMMVVESYAHVHHIVSNVTGACVQPFGQECIGLVVVAVTDALPRRRSLTPLVHNTAVDHRPGPMTVSLRITLSRTIAPFGHLHAGRKHAALDRAVDLAAVGEQGAVDVRAWDSRRHRRPLLAAGVDDPVRIVEVEGRILGHRLMLASQ